MFDYHLHSYVSYDAEGEPKEIVKEAERRGLKEICFTDHLDYELGKPREYLKFDVASYSEAYDCLTSSSVKIRRGVEVGMTPWNIEEIKKDIQLRQYDYVIGSLHHVDNLDPYYTAYWSGKTVEQAEEQYFRELLHCVSIHDDFDVLGHITYIGKVDAHPARRLVSLEKYRPLVTEIMEILVQKGKGLEVNTSGVDLLGDYLPTREYIQLFHNMGGQIVTVGSDAHTSARVGKHCFGACEMLRDIFGYVCTFANREPIFHKL